MRLGNFEIAIESFKNVIGVKPDHAIAHHYISLCYLKLNNSLLYAHHRELAANYRNEFWDAFIKEFEIDFPQRDMVF
jgi:hypothetical protein